MYSFKRKEKNKQNIDIEMSSRDKEGLKWSKEFKESSSYIFSNSI